MSRHARRIGRVAGFLACVAGLALLLTLSSAKPAAADNCQDFTDCFATANSASDALLGLTFLGMLSMALNFIPYVGTAKGIIEAITGKDLLTGQELSATDRLLGLIPGGLGRGGRFAKIFGKADDVGDLARVGSKADDVADASRIRPDMPPPRPGGGPPDIPPGGGRRPPGEPPVPPPGRNPPEGPWRDPEGRWAPDNATRQNWRDTWWNENRPHNTPNGQETTVPRRPPSSTHTAGGTPETVPRRGTPQDIENIRLQNSNADVLAQHGFDVHHRTPGDMSPQGFERTADYKIGDKYFDHKVARGSNARNFVDNNLDGKATQFANTGKQAERFVVDLSKSSITPQEIREAILAKPPGTTNIQEVLVVKNGEVFPIYP